MIVKPFKSQVKDEVEFITDKAALFTRLPFVYNAYGSSGSSKSTVICNYLVQDFDGIRSFFTA